MRSLTFIVCGAAVCCTTAALAASADYYLKIEGVSRPDATGPIYLQVKTGDLDGDGLPDDRVLRLSCSGGAPSSASLQGVVAPRDSTSGMATGKRQYAPIRIVKEWSPATPKLSAMRASWNVKKMEGARVAADSGWTDVTLSNADGLCPAAEAATKATKTRSNIQNN